MHRSHIIIVNYNAGDWLARALDSVVNFAPECAVSVVDNASSDNSIELAQQRHGNVDIEWILNADNRGFAAANNQVLATLDCEFAILMNPDCELSEGTLPALYAAFEAHAKMGMASGLILNEDGSTQTTCRRTFPTPWSALVRMLQLHRLFPNYAAFTDFDQAATLDAASEFAFVDAISGAFMMVRRSALEEVGLLDEDYFMHCEDLDWCKRFELAGWQIGSVPAAVVTHAKGVSSKSRPVAVLWSLHKGMLRFFDKFYSDEYVWPIRYTVKVGVLVSFVGRAALSWWRR
ncbi:glycosyltransferase family 2 protein [Arenicella chitinivorans]|nr:glycosyltransferase family 2 protein [Arenicella chitinivorans]